MVLLLVNIAMFLIVIPVGYLARQRINAVKATGISYVILFCLGNVIFWFACESISFFGLVVALINRSL